LTPKRQSPIYKGRKKKLYKKERPNLSRFTEDIKSNKHLRSKYKDRIKIEKTNTTMRSVLQGVILIEKEEKDDEDE